MLEDALTVAALLLLAVSPFFRRELVSIVSEVRAVRGLVFGEVFGEAFASAALLRTASPRDATPDRTA